MLAQVIAAGVSSGFSGKWDPIHALAESLDVPFGRARGAGGAPVGDIVGRLYQKIGGRYGGHSRNAGG